MKISMSFIIEANKIFVTFYPPTPLISVVSTDTDTSKYRCRSFTTQYDVLHTTYVHVMETVILTKLLRTLYLCMKYTKSIITSDSKNNIRPCIR